MICYPKVKINLGLHVVRRREDGFHDLETLFVPCDAFGDTLEIVSGDDYSRTLASLRERYALPAPHPDSPAPQTPGPAPQPASPAPQLAQAISPDGKLMVTLARKEGVTWDPLSDLTARAYRLLDEAFHLPPAKIFLEKTSPVGAGLGGGSADGAEAIRLLDQLFDLHLSLDEMARIAARLGSDCAFFLHGRPMLGKGRGDVLEPMDIDLSPYEMEVIVPEGVSVSTADAYRGIVPKTPAKPLEAVLRQDPRTWKDELVNDFEPTVFAKYPVLAHKKAELYRKGAVYAAMSGSGSALFGLFPKK